MFLAVLALALCGCGDASDDIEVAEETRNPPEILWSSDGFRLWESPHFITEYIVPTKIKAIHNVPGNVYIEATGNVYRTFRGDKYKDYDKALFFAQMYGDISYSGTVHEGQHPAIAYPIEKMTIKCDKDFDAEHPAGKPLDDIVKFDFDTYYDFVKSEYTSYKDNPWWLDPEEEEFSLLLNSVNADVTKLVGADLGFYSIGNIRFVSVPEELGEYKFTLETTIDGEVFKSEFTFTFE